MQGQFALTNSRQKGKRGELEWAKFLTDFGFPARRGQQFSGDSDSPDVVCETMPGFWPEVKRREKFNLNATMAKAFDESGNKVPYCAHRRNGQRWLVTMFGDHWMSLHVEIKFLRTENHRLLQLMKYQQIAIDELTEELANA